MLKVTKKVPSSAKKCQNEVFLSITGSIFIVQSWECDFWNQHAEPVLMIPIKYDFEKFFESHVYNNT